jgi:hypothetical protein
MGHLPRDERGYPVPWFVKWLEGKPDFRIVDGDKFRQAIRFGNCWICGEPLGRLKTFVLGSMNIVNRVTSEPGNHLECADYAVKACPFLLLPAAKYRKAELPAGTRVPPQMNSRNPGVTALWTCVSAKLLRYPNNQYLLRVGDPVHVDFVREGKLATREQILESIDGGFAKLWNDCGAELGETLPLARARIDTLVELENMYARAMELVP